MRKYLLALFVMNSALVFSQTEKLIYHDIRVDQAGKIIPWFSDEPGKAFSSAIMSLMHFRALMIPG